MKPLLFFRLAFLILGLSACQSHPTVTKPHTPTDSLTVADCYRDDFGYLYASPQKVINLLEQDSCFIRNKCEISIFALTTIGNIPTYVCDITYPATAEDNRPLKCIADTSVVSTDTLAPKQLTSHQFYRGNYPRMRFKANAKCMEQPAYRFDLNELPITRNSERDADTITRKHFTYIFVSVYDPFIIVRNSSVKKVINNYLAAVKNHQTVWIEPIRP